MEEDICIPPHLTYRRPDFDFPKNHLRSVSRERNIPTAFVPTEKKKKKAKSFHSKLWKRFPDVPIFFFFL